MHTNLADLKVGGRNQLLEKINDRAASTMRNKATVNEGELWIEYKLSKKERPG
jgi:hypothetical protein